MEYGVMIICLGLEGVGQLMTLFILKRENHVLFLPEVGDTLLHKKCRK